jgi:hypothetical protein
MVQPADIPLVTIFIGRFGSGKTEIAINYALRLARAGLSPFLVDLDLVTPYFRSREAADVVRCFGVDIVAPPVLTRSVDVPAVVPAILGAIQQLARPVVLDVGGDKQGVRALAQYSDALWRRGYRMEFVVNPFRPGTDSPEGVVSAVRELEQASRLRVHGLVSNPNLMGETVAGTVREGHEAVRRAAYSSRLPVAFLAVAPEHVRPEDFRDLDVPVMELVRHFKLPWEGLE